MIKEIKENIMASAKRKCAIAQNHYDCGMRDCKAGIYDKWYRYNADDEGLAYDAGWQEKNKEVLNEEVIFIDTILSL